MLTIECINKRASWIGHQRDGPRDRLSLYCSRLWFFLELRRLHVYQLDYKEKEKQSVSSMVICSLIIVVHSIGNDRRRTNTSIIVSIISVVPISIVVTNGTRCHWNIESVANFIVVEFFPKVDIWTETSRTGVPHQRHGGLASFLYAEEAEWSKLFSHVREKIHHLP